MTRTSSLDAFAAGDGGGDTICAVATPPGGARRAVVRVSGPDAREVAALLRDTSGAPLDADHLAARDRGTFAARLFDGRGELPVLVAWMPGPRSFTGEDVLELHLVGAVPLVEAALDAVVRDGARPARAGEFTRRAFENGRLDLARAEGVLELVESRTEDERRAAVALLTGGLSARVDGLRDPLEDLCSLCEASLDFDESETGHVAGAEIATRVEHVLAALDEAVRWERARPVRDRGASIVFVGPPNAGKSSLFNRIAAGDALVAPVAGTTRDVLRARGELDGARVEWLDLPGLDGRVEGEVAGADEGDGLRRLDRAAQDRARAQLRAADVLALVLPADGPRAAALALPDALLADLPPDVPRVLVWNGIDRPDARPAPDAALLERAGPAIGVVPTSAARGEGVAELERAVAALLGGAAVGGAAGSVGGAGAVSRDVAARHLRGLAGARERLAEARGLAEEGWPLDAVASVLRAALDALAAVTGRTTTEGLLDRVFARFCLGK